MSSPLVRPQRSEDDASSATRSSMATAPGGRRRRRTASLPSTRSRRQQEEEDSLVACLKRLRVAPMTEAQKARQRQQRQRDFRNRIRTIALRSSGKDGAGKAQSLSPPSEAAKGRESSTLLLAPTRLFGSQVLSPCQSGGPAARRRLMRCRHASDSGKGGGGEEHQQVTSNLLCRGLARSLTEVTTCCRELELFNIKSPEQQQQQPQADSFTQMQLRRDSDGEEEEEQNDEDVDSLAHQLMRSTSEVTPSCFGSGRSSGSSCAQQAKDYLDVSVNDLAGYLEDSVVFPKKMSRMAEMMYT